MRSASEGFSLAFPLALLGWPRRQPPHCHSWFSDIASTSPGVNPVAEVAAHPRRYKLSASTARLQMGLVCCRPSPPPKKKPKKLKTKENRRRSSRELSGNGSVSTQERTGNAAFCAGGFWWHQRWKHPRGTGGVSLRPRSRAAKLKIPPPSGCLAADRGVKGRGERWGSAPGSDASPRRVPPPPRQRSRTLHLAMAVKLGTGSPLRLN